MEQISTGKNDVPSVSVTIADCGIVNGVKNSDEADFDVKHKAMGQSNNKTKSLQQEARGVMDEEAEVDEEIELPEEEDDGTPKTKSQLLKERLRKLKMKTNQARQLNRQEVLREGERLGSVEGMAKDRKRQAMHDKKLRQQEWQAHNAKALSIAAENGVDGKAMVEPAVESIRRTFSKQQKAESRRFGVNDYYNPEGQHRNYERNVKSVPTTSSLENATSTFDPTMTSTRDDAQEREGARRLANELKRRIEKKAKRKRDEFEASDVGYINMRNKRFNEKISRNYDSHSAEIEKSLERGTAL
jgi:pre-mRNA-splicing factor SYF2